MTERPIPVFRTSAEVLLTGTMATYDSQADASQGIPEQWRRFRLAASTPGGSAHLYGASPCTNDGKIHYLTGVAGGTPENLPGAERLTLGAGEYAVVQVTDPALLRDTWVWLLSSWLPSSGRKERTAPEFERFTEVDERGLPQGPVEIWIPLEPLDG